MVGLSNASIYFIHSSTSPFSFERGITEFQHYDESFAHQVFITGLVWCRGEEDFTSFIKGF
jgi:hypothetical protein